MKGFICLFVFNFLVINVWSGFPFNNPALPWDERVNDLVSRLTIEEITQQMARGGRLTYAPAIPRLGIKPYPWGSECLRGDVKAGPATSFPQAIGLAATFSTDMLFKMANATGMEVRAKYNNYSSHQDYGEHTSASCWSPVINIMRDPRWGRNAETYGEDPYLSGILAQAYVKGLQGDHPRYIMANAGCKHFDVYGGPENIPVSRHKFDAIVSESDWRMTFLPAFKACVDAGTYSLMCSYNSVNGVPACANKKLLTDILRTEWGFKGYVISDEGAIEDILANHHYTHSIPDTAAAAVNAGCNLEDGPAIVDPFFNGITDAVKQGKLTEHTVREAVKPLFYTRMRLGLFDPPNMNPYSQLDPSKGTWDVISTVLKTRQANQAHSAVKPLFYTRMRLGLAPNMNPYAQLVPSKIVQSAEHRELAVKLAMASYVLLKNDDQFLPLKTGTKVNKLAIIGPMADNVDGIFGGYAPNPDPKYIVTPRKGLSVLGNTSHYAAGCKDTHCTDYKHGSSEVKQAVQGADMVILCLGTGANIESESNDRADIELPGMQRLLLLDTITYASGKPVILLLFNGGPLNITYAIENFGVPVIIECFYPAQATGEALRRMFYMEGKSSNPAGRLPNTWPLADDPLPPITNYSMDGRTYRYYKGASMFPFGYGLSYTTFMYNDVLITKKITYKPGLVVNVVVYLKNTGKYDGEEVVQLYAAWTNYSVPSIPKVQLVGVKRLSLTSMNSVQFSIPVNLDTLQVWDTKQLKMTVLQGDYMLYAGGQQPFTEVKLPSNVVKTMFTIT